MTSFYVGVIILVVMVFLLTYITSIKQCRDNKKSTTSVEPVKKHKPGELTEEFKHLAGEEADYFPRN